MRIVLNKDLSAIDSFSRCDLEPHTTPSPPNSIKLASNFSKSRNLVAPSASAKRICSPLLEEVSITKSKQ